MGDLAVFEATRPSIEALAAREDRSGGGLGREGDSGGSAREAASGGRFGPEAGDLGGFVRGFPWAEPEDVPEEIVYLDRAPRGGETTEERSFLYLDCGAWGGDQKAGRLERSFAVACGGAVALCEFVPGAPYAGLALSPSPGAGALDRLLRALAGPQKNDVQVRRVAASPAADEARAADRIHLFLPSLHFPIVTRMPEHAADLIPDPTIARCFCHGPILRRLMFGMKAVGPYQAVGCALGRDPNEWFYAMADTFRDAAEDLVKLVSRLQRFRGKERLHVVQLGDMFEVWAGFGCCFQSSGRASIVVPKALTGLDPAELAGPWRSVVVDTPARRAVERLCSLPGVDRTWLHGERALSPSNAGEVATRRPTVEAPGVFFAERAPVPAEAERAPFGVFDLLLQQSVFNPRRRVRPAAGRGALAERAVRLFLERDGGSPESAPGQSAGGAANTAHVDDAGHVPNTMSVQDAGDAGSATSAARVAGAGGVPNTASEHGARGATGASVPFPLYVCGHTGSACLTRISVVRA